MSGGQDETKNGGKKDAKFMKKMQTDAYMGSQMNLEDRLNRNRHYRSRDVVTDNLWYTEYFA